MLTILNDPAGITGRQRFTWNTGKTLQQNIEEHLPAGGGCLLRINGVEVDPRTDARLDVPPELEMSATVVRRPEGFELATWALIATFALAVYTYASLPKPPNMDAGGSSKDSPNNSLTGQTNVARAYQAIPDVFGYRRVWPDLIQPSTVEYIDHQKFVTEWLCISRGKGTITAVQYADTPIGDIDGASFEVFEPGPTIGYPEHGTTTLLDVVEAFESAEVNGQEIIYPVDNPSISRSALVESTAGFNFDLTFTDGVDLADLKAAAGTGSAIVTFASPVGGYDAGFFDSRTCLVDSYVVAGADVTFTFEAPEGWDSAVTVPGRNVVIRLDGTTPEAIGPFTLPAEADFIRWNTVFLRGLKGSVVVNAEWWAVDGDGVEIGGTREDADYTYTADTYDQRFFTTDVEPAAGPGLYRIQFTRTSGKVDDGGADIAKLEEVYAARRYPTKDLPGVTVIRVTTKATTQATGFSERKFNLRWLRHVRTLEAPDISESRNFARAMAHLWAVAGNGIGELDTDKLAEINADLGEDHPLLRFDGSLDDADMSLGERLQMVANHARCQLWRDGMKWTVTRDQARWAPEVQLDYRNLAASGDSTISYAAHLPASNDGVEVEYVDEATQSKKAYVRLNISSGAPVAGISSNAKKMSLPGCCTLAQAENRAQLEARRLLYQRTSVSDTALGDGGALGLGALVRWIDPNDFAGDDGLQAGEVLAIDGNIITTSEPLDWGGHTEGRMLFTGTDGRPLGIPVICYPVAAANGAELATVQPGLYVADADRQCGSRYAFAVGLTQAEVEAAGLYVTTEINPAADGTASLALAAYDIRMYEAD